MQRNFPILSFLENNIDMLQGQKVISRDVTEYSWHLKRQIAERKILKGKYWFQDTVCVKLRDFDGVLSDVYGRGVVVIGCC